MPEDRQSEGEPVRNGAGADVAVALAGSARWAAVAVTVGVVVVGLLGWALLDRVAGVMQGAGDVLHGVADWMHSRTVQESFQERLTQVVSTEGDVLELARVEMEETFRRTDSRSVLGEMIYLGTTVSEIRVPVVYRYHLKLSDPWQLEIEDGVCRVRAPMIRPTQPPALRTEGMEKKSESGWLRFNAAENLAALEKSLTPRLEQRAGDERHLGRAREASRRSVEVFVRKWMLESHPEIGTLELQVQFPDELDATRNVLPES